MSLTPSSVRQYHIFLASPSDVNDERQIVRQFFEQYNRHTAQLWDVRFEVIDWENFASIGVGRAQELITKQTLDRFKDSLALVIGIMAQRFGSPTGLYASGTEEEFRWALESRRGSGFPEVKWFFKRVERFVAPSEPDEVVEALEQWRKVRAFRQELRNLDIYGGEYGEGQFRETFEHDLSLWLADRERPWVSTTTQRSLQSLPGVTPSLGYYELIQRDFHRLDIAGIDNERAFEIPLSEIYVRLHVMFDDEAEMAADDVQDTGPIDIQTALLRFPKLAIVGDPGSGKSTFLKYVALMLARSVLTNKPTIALEKLCIEEPLPIPMFISCWDLSDFLKREGTIKLQDLLLFLVERLASLKFQIAKPDIEALLISGNCCLLFDGLDEVPTDAGRAAVSRLLEDCVKQFPRNRYVVTSRVRAYSGDTILKADFARCDIQPFDALDRAQFLKNWVALLFKSSLGQVMIDGTDANREFQSLTEGIETNDRIRSLAVNPLLLTVIAIVHWNRKRLPEQRVDLYSECVDVLLGQRKEAEHIQLSRKTGVLDEQQEEQQVEERAWVRKRFAEIALHILEGQGNREEASRADVVGLLAPRFIDRGAPSKESAEFRANLFLQRQEVRSGLLVSRREQSYRFVHLTFQEYLAAWHLCNQEFSQVAPVIEPRLRQQRWFETLQLLGGEWAKQSDEKLDSYLDWLLKRQGNSITERAPVVALCANIVKDTSGVAELGLETRKQFRKAVEGTLDAFKPASGVPALTQIEIVEALGQLGAPVKGHLIEATKSGLFQVRRRAIEMILPHLSDEELFNMTHILKDRSKEPIKTYLLCLLARDPSRTVDLIVHRNSFSEKATEAFAEIRLHFRQKLPPISFGEAVQSVYAKGSSYYGWSGGNYSWPSRARLVSDLPDEQTIWSSVTADSERGVRARALEELTKRHINDSQVWGIVRERAVKDDDGAVRLHALGLLSENQRDDPQTWALASHAVASDKDPRVRKGALEFVTTRQKDEPQTWELVRAAAEQDPDPDIRSRALELLAENQIADPRTWDLMCAAVVRDENPRTRGRALQLLTVGQRDESETWELVRTSTKDENAEVRKLAIKSLVGGKTEEPKTWELVRTAIKDEDANVRKLAIESLLGSKKEETKTWEIVREAAAADKSDAVRILALQELVSKNATDPETIKLVESAVLNGIGYFRLSAFFGVVQSTFSDRATRVLLSRDLDALQPGIDIRESITLQRVEKAARALGINEVKVQELYEELVNQVKSRFGLELRLEWKSTTS